jgi:hypothetical protein
MERKVNAKIIIEKDGEKTELNLTYPSFRNLWNHISMMLDDGFVIHSLVTKFE